MDRVETVTIGDVELTPGEQFESSDHDGRLVFERPEFDDEGQLALVFSVHDRPGETIQFAPIQLLHEVSSGSMWRQDVPEEGTTTSQ